MMYVNLKKYQFGAIDSSFDKYGIKMDDMKGTFCLQEDSKSTNRSVSSSLSENFNTSYRRANSHHSRHSKKADSSTQGRRASDADGKRLQRSDSARGGKGISTKPRNGPILLSDLESPDNFNPIIETPRKRDGKAQKNIRKVNLLQLEQVSKLPSANRVSINNADKDKSKYVVEQSSLSQGSPSPENSSPNCSMTNIRGGLDK